MDIIENQIQELLRDRSSGSQELAEKALKIIKRLYSAGNTASRINNFLEKTAERFPQMVAIIKLKEHFSDEISDKTIHEFENLLSDKSYIENASLLFDTTKKIITFSRSSAVEDVIIYYKKYVDKVTCCHSLPLGEGKKFAEDLKKNMISSQLVEDGELSRFIPDSDFMLLGADAITEDLFMNKIGTLQAVLLAQHFKKPVYVISSPLKKIKKSDYSLEKLGQYFEAIDNSLITDFIY